MKTRAICGLIWASESSSPFGAVKRQPRGRKGAGCRYERELAKALPSCRHGQWFQFQDLNGPGHCQTDLLLDLPGATVVLEAKYTWTQQGHWQVERLYRPILEKVYRKPSFGLVVCKVLTDEVGRGEVCSSLEEALERAALGRRTVLHWTGHGLGPLHHSCQVTHLAPSLAQL